MKKKSHSYFQVFFIAYVTNGIGREHQMVIMDPNYRGYKGHLGTLQIMKLFSLIIFCWNTQKALLFPGTTQQNIAISSLFMQILRDILPNQTDTDTTDGSIGKYQKVSEVSVSISWIGKYQYRQYRVSEQIKQFIVYQNSLIRRLKSNL